jgi:ligand-binding SRPBCC domain-containing protein
MKTYRLVREQIIARRQDKVFAFFSDARNLETITPRWLHFQILTPGEIEMRVGTMIQYALRVHGLPLRWTTAITIWKPPFEFVDVQLNGPYALWHHRHTFEPRGDETRMTDEVTYALPLGWLGRVIHGVLVQRDLEMIFGFREKAIRDIFDPLNSTPVHSRKAPAFGPGWGSLEMVRRRAR